MGGKGQRRREKNYQAAHGGESRLPPPPKLEELEAIPSKLRKIMQLKNPSSANKRPKQSNTGAGKESKKRGVSEEKEKNLSTQDLQSSVSFNAVNGDRIQSATVPKDNDHEEAVINQDRKKKRKRKEVKDLRFLDIDQAISVSKKKKRKEYLEAKKKKKQKKAKTDDVLNFPGRETIKFGDIVQAPPKLSVPKALKNVYQERVRLGAIEAYRKHKGWTSRPGVQIPKPEHPS